MSYIKQIAGLMAVMAAMSPYVAVAEDTDVAQYDNIIYAASQTIEPSSTSDLVLSMKNTVAPNAFAFILTLPEGFGFALSTKGRAQVQFVGDRTDDHSLTTRIIDDGTLSVAGISLNGGVISGNDGEFLSIKVTTPNVTGSYTLTLENEEIATLAADAYRVEVPVLSTIMVGSPAILGDADGDGDVDDDDATAVSQYILTEQAPAKWNAENANANQMDGIEVGDIIAIEKRKTK